MDVVDEKSKELNQKTEMVAVDNDSRASALFQVQIQNLPVYCSMKQLRNILKRVNVQPKKTAILPKHAFASFLTEEERDRAVELINGYKFKGKSLTAKASQKRTSLPIQKSGAESSDVDLEEKMLNAVTPLRSIPYKEQLILKQKEARNYLISLSKQIRKVSKQNFTGAHFGTLAEILESTAPLSYRNKCEFTVGLSPEGAVTVGFQASGFEAGRNFVLPIQKCCHIPETMKKCALAFQHFIESSGRPPYIPDTDSGFWKVLALRCFRFDLMMIVTVHPQDSTPEELNQIKRSLVAQFYSRAENFYDSFRVTSLYFQQQTKSSQRQEYELLGDSAPFIYETLFGRLRFRVSPGAFFQTNSGSAEILYDAIGKLCKVDKNTVIFDICCGTGTIGICLADLAKYVIGIEICKDAVRDAEINAKSNGKRNCKFISGAAEDVFPEIYHHVPPSVGLSDVLGILDPPRAGLADKLICAVRKMNCLRRLIYVSCDPKGASKNFLDLCRLSSNRYIGEPFHLKACLPVDMCPQTKLCEWIMLFERCVEPK